MNTNHNDGGRSGSGIIAKLNMNKYPAKLILHMPDDIVDFDELEYDADAAQEGYDFILVFIWNLEQFSQHLQSVMEKQLLNDNGYVYFAYPKKNNPKYKEYIDRDSFFQQIPVDEDGYVRNSRLKFSKMVSLDEVFTVIGLKSQAKKATKTSESKSSQRVDDYIAHIADIRHELKHASDLLDFYNKLPSGYQKDWARYIYSAKRSETREKRILEMKEILAEGYKSIDLYRRRNQQ